jgi:4-aminobutyrate aminotransferase/(S)-3-amino-2-methylpropionate transaminase
VIEVIEEEGLLRLGIDIGERLSVGLQELSDPSGMGCLGEVRGLGAMVALEIVSNPVGMSPDPDIAEDVATKCLENRLIVLTCCVYRNVVSILMPLTADTLLIDEGKDILKQSPIAVGLRTAI